MSDHTSAFLFQQERKTTCASYRKECGLLRRVHVWRIQQFRARFKFDEFPTIYEQAYYGDKFSDCNTDPDSTCA